MNAEQDRMLLVLAAAEGNLDATQRSALEDLRADDPSVDEEIAALKDVLSMVKRDGRGWDESAMGTSPSAGVLDAALDQIASEEAAAFDEVTHRSAVDDVPSVSELSERRTRRAERDGDAPPQPGRRGLLLGMAAAGLVATGAVGSDVIRRIRPDMPTGVPGELGAYEPLSMTGTPADASVEMGLIAHTWGTETVMVVDGSEPGAIYEVVLVANDGTNVGSGSFLGTDAPLDCEMNAAILRADVTEILIVAQGGRVWGQAQLPAVST